MVDILEQAKQRFKKAQEAEQKQREREKEDLRFQVPELQWDEKARNARLGDFKSTARPILSISKIDQPIQLITNQQAAAHLGIQISPLSPEADDDVADVLQGLYRRIERDSQAHLARSWAFDRAVKCGRGAYRVNTRWDEEGGYEFDQVITIERIFHQEAVYFDPSCEKPDFSDGEWAFVTTWMPLEEFRREFPKADATLNEQLAFADLVNESPEWAQGEGDERAIQVAEYFYKEHARTVRCLLKDGRIVDKGELKKEDEVLQERTFDDVKVKWVKMTGFKILEEQDWNGKYVPLIPVFGRELQPFDEERRWHGLIGPAKDAQKIYNFAASEAVEIAALEPRAPWVGAEGQFADHETEWQESNIRNFPYLEYKPVTIGQQLAPPPQRAQIDASRLSVAMTLLQQADQYIQIATATYDPSLGRISSKERSGIAIARLQGQGEAASSNYLQALADVSMTYEAKVVLDLIPKIYDRPGRQARTLSTEDDTEMVLLNQPFYVHPQTRRPIPVEVVRDDQGNPIEPLKPLDPRALVSASMPLRQPMPQPGMPMPPGGGGMPPEQPPQPKIQYFDLRKGVYAVAVSIGRSRQTLSQEAADEIGQILQAQPQLMTLIGPTYFRFRDFQGAREIADILAKLRDEQYPNLMDDKGDGMTLEQAQAKVRALEQQAQELQQALEQAMKALETEQIKQQAMLQKAQMDNETKREIATAEQQTKILLESMEQRFNQIEKILARIHEVDRDKFQAAHETALEARKAVTDAMKPAPAMEQPLEREEPV